jgi:hypothetical protein
MVRRVVPRLERDRVLAPDITALADAVAAGIFTAATTMGGAR